MGSKRKKATAAASGSPTAGHSPALPPPHFPITPFALELSYALLALVREGSGFLQRIGQVRQALADESGIRMPLLRIRDNARVPPHHYRLLVRGIVHAEGQVYPDRRMAVNPGSASEPIEGLVETDPVFGLPVTWIAPGESERVRRLGYEVLEADQVLLSHIHRVARREAWQFLTYQETSEMLWEVSRTTPTLVEALRNSGVPHTRIQHVLQNLAEEQVPLRDLEKLLEQLLVHAERTPNPEVLTEYVRQGLLGWLHQSLEPVRGVVPVVVLHRQLEERLAGAMERTESDTFVNLSPEQLRRLQNSLSAAVRAARLEEPAVVVACDPRIRRTVWRLLNLDGTETPTYSYTELAGLDIKSIRVAEEEDQPGEQQEPGEAG